MHPETIQLFRIPLKAHPWYQKHVESFVQHLPGIRLLDRKPEHIEQWLNQVARIPDTYAPWHVACVPLPVALPAKKQTIIDSFCQISALVELAGQSGGIEYS